MNRKSNCKCSECNKNIYRRPSQLESGRVFCSRRCSGQAQRILKKCSVCLKKYYGSKKTCSRICANKNRVGIVYDSSNAKNKAVQSGFLKSKLAEQRGGVCEMCSHKNYLILQVHHVVHKSEGGTNVFSNLKLLCPNCHATQHQGNGFFQGSKVAKR